MCGDGKEDGRRGEGRTVESRSGQKVDVVLEERMKVRRYKCYLEGWKKMLLEGNGKIDGQEKSRK